MIWGEDYIAEDPSVEYCAPIVADRKIQEHIANRLKQHQSTFDDVIGRFSMNYVIVVADYTMRHLGFQMIESRQSRAL